MASSNEVALVLQWLLAEDLSANHMDLSTELLKYPNMLAERVIQGTVRIR